LNPSEKPKYFIVIGASAGGITALQSLVAGLRADIPASISVVVHTAAHTPLVLDKIVERAGTLPCTYAENQVRLQTGHIYIAPPDRHLLVEDSIARVVYGPKENRHRPSVDSLFRSAALAYRHRAIGVILSGLLDNGTAGLLAIKKLGGIAIVQDPEEAAFASMPESALRWVDVDYCLPVSEIAARLNELVRKERAKPAEALEEPPDYIQLEKDAAEGASLHGTRAEKMGQQSPFSCPDCGAPLYEIEEVKHRRYRCLVGHAFSAQSLLYSQTEQAEKSLWEAVRVMQGNKILLERMLSDFSAQEQYQIEVDIAKLKEELEIVRNVLSERQDARGSG
jgi:two-component system chemotaxis response regulator CheB